MPTSLQRPEDLPDFLAPPLNEVVLGVQFSRPKGYQQILAGEVWNLFRVEYPVVQELPPLPPMFETFGLPHPGIGGPSFSIVNGATHNRFWFLRPDGDELIQFQEDRLLHNWRKVGDGRNPYPRFESMIERYQRELVTLQSYMSSLGGQSLSINQCEITYVNHISAEDHAELDASEWLRFISFDGYAPEDLNIAFREVICGENDRPEGRLICEASTAHVAGRRIIALTLTVRGAPKGSDVQSAIQFLSRGRELIVNRFAEVTTETAHRIWEREK